jgi:hypothetical protein
MATIDLGKISFIQKGTWASSTSYTAKDVVQYTDDNEVSSYVAVASSSNQAPSTNGTVNTSYWALFAKGATVGSTNQGVYSSSTAYQKNAVVQYTDSGVVSTYLAVVDSTNETPSTGGTVNSSKWQLIAKGTASVAIAWQATAKTADFTASASEGYFVDTNSGSVTITTPSSPSAGDEFIVVDLRGTFGTNKVSFDGNGSDKIKGGTINVDIEENYASVRVVYSGATYGWLPVSSSAVDAQTLTAKHNLQYLVVAGGGGGGGDNGGGGGAGGMRYNSSKDFQVIKGTQYTITVGSGGLGGTNDPPAQQPNSGASQGATGGSSIFSTITSTGGGGGGSGGGFGNPGGSGGGGSQNAVGGTGNTPSTSPSQGNNGGNHTDPPGGGAGGGGAGAAASNTSGASSGGAGLANSITGSAVTYAGGGGGGEHQDSGGQAQPGGSGGGGNGSNGGNGNPGTDGLGGGGGGGQQDGSARGGTGGSGVVILRMLTADYSGTVTGSPNVATSGSDTIISWTSSGSYTA